MADEIRQVDYYHVTVPDRAGGAARILTALYQSGITLLAFSGFPRGARRSQLDFIPEDADAFAKAARDLGLRLSRRKIVFLIRGEDRPGAVARVLNKLAQIPVNVTSVQAISAGAGWYGALLWVKPPHLPKAVKELCLSQSDHETKGDIVDEASEESFPASDPPSWTARLS